MGDVSGLSIDRVSELVLGNRVIRAPYYKSAHDAGVEFTDPERGFQWGADAIPALMSLFRLENDPRDDHPDGWIGFARHWRGPTVRVDFDLFTGSKDPAPILIVTALSGRTGEVSLEDPDIGEIVLPDSVPSKEDWIRRDKQYKAVRRNDDTDGALAVQAFISALPGWKQEVALLFDDIIDAEVPQVRRGVKWHQPFYGIEDEGWFASFNPFTNYVKLSFISNQYLDPRPPHGTDPTRQAIDVVAEDSLDEDLIATWVRQAADYPGLNW